MTFDEAITKIMNGDSDFTKEQMEIIDKILIARFEAEMAQREADEKRKILDSLIQYHFPDNNRNTTKTFKDGSGMTLDEAIKHASEVADKSSVCTSCATEHKQLAEWLKELKHLRSTRDELVSSLKEAVTIKSESCANAYHQFCSTCDSMRKAHFCEAEKWRKAIEKAGWSETAEPQTEFPKENYTEK